MPTRKYSSASSHECVQTSGDLLQKLNASITQSANAVAKSRRLIADSQQLLATSRAFLSPPSSAAGESDGAATRDATDFPAGVVRHARFPLAAPNGRRPHPPR
jgi:hypothetical protein